MNDIRYISLAKGLMSRLRHSTWFIVSITHFVVWVALSPVLYDLFRYDSFLDVPDPLLLIMFYGIVKLAAFFSFPVTDILETWVRIFPLGGDSGDSGDMGEWPANGFRIFCLLIPVNSIVLGVVVAAVRRFLISTALPDHWRERPPN